MASPACTGYQSLPSLQRESKEQGGSAGSQDTAYKRRPAPSCSFNSQSCARPSTPQQFFLRRQTSTTHHIHTHAANCGPPKAPVDALALQEKQAVLVVVHLLDV